MYHSSSRAEAVKSSIKSVGATIVRITFSAMALFAAVIFIVLFLSKIVKIDFAIAISVTYPPILGIFYS